MRMIALLKKVIADKRGVQTLEFAIICAMIIIGLVSAVKGLADENSRMWNLVSSRQAEAVGQ
ncbi:MAG: hypothetical protein KDE55_13980 [Novosphingobium sp.]|nr:hypothetical protein [Novosphingobium sp.]